MENSTPQIIAYVVTTDREYSAKNENGDSRELHRGYPIYEGETLSSDGSGEIVVQLVGSQQRFTLSGDNSLLFDQSLLENGFVDEETQSEEKFIELALSGELTPEDIENLEATAAGEEGGSSSTESTDQFDQRNGEQVDVNAGLIPTQTLNDGFILDVGNDASVPLANPDLNSIREGQASVSGNVVDNPTDDNQDDFIGTDTNDLPVTGVKAGDNAGTVALGNVGSSISGQFGSVVIEADGSYTYTLDNNNPTVQGLNDFDAVFDIFTYTITDGNGDTSTTTLTIVINGENDVTVATPPDTPTTDPDPIPEPEPDPALTLNDEVESVIEGSITITDLSENLNLLSNDNLGTNGGQITSITYKDESGNIQTTPAGQATDTQYGSITVFINGAWRFTSDPTEFHGTIVDVINYTVTDNDGNTANAAFNILVTDDVPTATGDFTSLLEDTVSVSGNVIDNDRIGADFTDTPVTGVKAGMDLSSDAIGNVGSSIDGQYGSVVVNSDGSYTYTLYNSKTEVQAIGPDEQLRDIFTYSITDTDGDISTTTLVIDINGDNELVLADDSATVVEGGVTIDNISENLNLLLNDTFTSFGGSISSFSYTDENGNSQIGTIGQATDTQYGTVRINGDGSWSFTSDTSEQHGTIIDVINYTVSDSNGNSASADFSIEVTDTVPSASVDTNSITEEDSSISGNVFDNDTMSADTTATPVTGIKAGNDTSAPATGNVAAAVAGSYGSVAINADGSYTYTLDNGNSAVQALNDGDTLTDVYTYSITDGDGDIATCTLTVTINGKDEPPPPPPSDNPVPTAVPDYANIFDGSPAVLQIDREPAIINREDIDIPVEVSDYFGTTYLWKLTGNVVDGDSNGIGMDSIGGDGPAIPGPVTDVQSPHDAVNSGVNTFIEGEFGLIIVQPNGEYEYWVPWDFVQGEVETAIYEQFTYTITDATNDSSTTTLTIESDYVPYVYTRNYDIQESGLVDNPADAHIVSNGRFWVDSLDGLSKLTIAGKEIDASGWLIGDNQPLNIPIPTAHGTMLLTEYSTSSGEYYSFLYTYTLESRLDHPAPPDTTDIVDDIEIVAEDSDGDLSTDIFPIATAAISIEDDSPTANADSITLQTYYQQINPSISGNVVDGGVQTGEVQDSVGADGASAFGTVTGIVAGNVTGPISGGIGATIPGIYGELTIDADGNYTYSIPGSAGFEGALEDEVFTYTITDGDDDTSTTTLTIQIPASQHNTNILKGEIIDLSGLVDNEIDLNQESDGFNNLTLSDVINLTDSTNNLTIFGDATESLNFKSEPSSQWSKSDTPVSDDGKTFDVYTNSGDSTVEVMVQQDINDQIV